MSASSNDCEFEVSIANRRLSTAVAAALKKADKSGAVFCQIRDRGARVLIRGAYISRSDAHEIQAILARRLEKSK